MSIQRISIRLKTYLDMTTRIVIVVYNIKV